VAQGSGGARFRGKWI